MNHNPFRWPVLLCVLPVLSGSCAEYARYHARPLDAGASAARLTDRRLGERTWDLQSLTEEALRHHHDIAVARAKYDAAVAAVRTAGERPNPTVALTPQVVTPWTNWIAGTYSVDFDWTIETAGKRDKRQLAAHALVRAAAANVIDAIWKVRSAVRKAFLEVHTAEQRATQIEAAIACQAELLAAFDERVKAGAESRSATIQARLLQAQMRLQAAESAKLAAVARASLAEAMGMSSGGIRGARFSHAAFESANHAVPGRKQALTHRADVLAALAEYAAAEALLRSEIARQYPDIHLNPGYSFDTGENKWTLGIGLTLPILNHNQGAVGEAEAKRKEAAARFVAVQAKVLAEYDRAAALLAAAKAKLATTDVLIEEQAEQVASEERLMQAGNGDRASLLSAQVERATTRIARVDALAEIQAAITELEAATQTHIP